MKKRNVISNEYMLLLVSILSVILFFLGDTLGLLSFLRSGISFVMYPIAFSANQAGDSGRNYFDTFVRLGEFRQEYNDLKVDVYEKEVENSFYALLKEENNSLKKQIALGNVEQTYVMVKVLGGSNFEYLRINKGSRDGIVIGDVVSLGNMFVGIVTRVDDQGSLVRLPVSKNNSLEAVVVTGGVENVRVFDTVNVLSKGVIKGSPDGVRIENMSMNSNLHDGDIVLVNDVRVGEFLVVGYLVGLSDNPASTSRSGYVAPIVEYDDLVTVFVRTNI